MIGRLGAQNAASSSQIRIELLGIVPEISNPEIMELIVKNTESSTVFMNRKS
ncbi:MAG: hypothetical protein AB1798_16855 [Spirochaetota bacterium]